MHTERKHVHRPDSNETWHISRSIPVAVLLAIGLQFSGMIWFGSALNQRVMNVELWKANAEKSQIESSGQLADLRADVKYLIKRVDAMESRNNVKR